MRQIRDVEEDLLDVIEDNINSELAEVDYTRGDSTPTPKQITNGVDNGQYPAIFIDISGVEFEDATMNYEAGNIRAKFTAEVVVVMKSTEQTKLKNWVSNYIEALTNILPNSVGIQTTISRIDIMELNNKTGGYGKAAGLVIEIIA